jgi:hypothetical protein
LPEQLVFSFTVVSFLAWVEWWQTGKRWAYAAVAVGFILALLSKESAVVFCALALLPLAGEPGQWRRAAIWVAPFVLLSAVYFLLNYWAKANHLHWNDGTFVLGLHFVPVVLNSMARIIWIWGAIGFVFLWWGRKRVSARVLAIGGLWILICLLPYSFVNYMPRVPSRHTYLAMVGLAILLSAALGSFSRQRVLTTVLGIAFLVTNGAYVAIAKHPQFVARAEKTEELIRLAREAPAEGYRVECFPLGPEIAAYALNQRLGVDIQKVSARRDGNCQTLTVTPVGRRLPGFSGR